MAQKNLHIIFNYSDGTKQIAIYEPIPMNSNLVSVQKAHYGMFNSDGEWAVLTTMTCFETKTLALDTCNAWNDTYKKEHRFFGERGW